MKNDRRDIFRELGNLEGRNGDLEKRDQQLMYEIRKLQKEKKSKFRTKIKIFLSDILIKTNKLFM